KSRLKNKFKPQDAEIVILVGSENGSTINYANAFYKQFIVAGKKAVITEMNTYTQYPKAKHLVIMTATYGQGDAPTNANMFLQKLQSETNANTLQFSVVGFGSLAYPDFCQFAFDADKALQQLFQRGVPVFTINDKSVEAFNQWVNQWCDATGISVNIPQEQLVPKPKQLKIFAVVSNTGTASDLTFLITLTTKKDHPFTSGDLLSSYPNNDFRVRVYSLGIVNGNVHLSVKRDDKGLGSGFFN